MSYAIELLDAEGQVVAGPQALLTLAAPFLSRLPGGNLSGSPILLLLLPVPGEDNDLPGEPYLSYLSPAIGYVRVVVENAGVILYRHPHTLGEVVGEGIRQWLDQLGENPLPAGYRLTGPSRIELNSHPTPLVEGVTEIQPYAEGEQPAFRIRPLPPPTPALRSLADFGAQPVEPDWPAPGRTDFVKVLVEQPVYDELSRNRAFSTEVEEGGFLVGHVYEDQDQPGTYLARITGDLAGPANRRFVSAFHLYRRFLQAYQTGARPGPSRRTTARLVSHTSVFGHRGGRPVQHRLPAALHHLPAALAARRSDQFKRRGTGAALLCAPPGHDGTVPASAHSGRRRCRMSALDTAVRVMEWACGPVGPPPAGDLRSLEALLEPLPAQCALLGRLAALTAAHLSLTAPPLGEVAPPGCSAFLLAAAIGAAQRPEAVQLVRYCDPPPCSAWELVARHAVVRPALAYLPSMLAETLCGASPLTALLLVPPRGEESQVVQLCERLLAHPDGRRLLVNQFCQPNVPSPLLAWRGRLLDRLRLAPDCQPFVLDVYEAALALYGSAWSAVTQEAATVLSGPELSKDRLDFVLAVAAWWEPLRALYRSHLDWLRARPYLDFYLYLQGIGLAQRVRSLGNIH